MDNAVYRLFSTDLIAESSRRLKAHQKYGEFTKCGLDEYIEHLVRLGLAVDDLIDHFSKPYPKRTKLRKFTRHIIR